MVHEVSEFLRVGGPAGEYFPGKVFPVSGIRVGLLVIAVVFVVPILFLQTICHVMGQNFIQALRLEFVPAQEQALPESTIRAIPCDIHILIYIAVYHIGLVPATVTKVRFHLLRRQFKGVADVMEQCRHPPIFEEMAGRPVLPSFLGKPVKCPILSAEIGIAVIDGQAD